MFFTNIRRILDEPCTGRGTAHIRHISAVLVVCMEVCVDLRGSAGFRPGESGEYGESGAADVKEKVVLGSAQILRFRTQKSFRLSPEQQVQGCWSRVGEQEQPGIMTDGREG